MFETLVNGEIRINGHRPDKFGRLPGRLFYYSSLPADQNPFGNKHPAHMQITMIEMKIIMKNLCHNVACYAGIPYNIAQRPMFASAYRPTNMQIPHHQVQNLPELP